MIQQTKTNADLEPPNVIQPNLTLTALSLAGASPPHPPNATGAPKQCLLILKGALSFGIGCLLTSMGTRYLLHHQ